MQRHHVSSSVIAFVAHDGRSNTLEVEFRNGRLYEYFGVPREAFDELLASDSVGKYFNEEIKPRYRSARVRRRDGGETRDEARR
jgi:hypothetical protein